MKNRIFKKLSGNAGESIGETLVALLISALALMMLAGAVSSAMRVVTRSKDAIDGYYEYNNALAARATTAPSGVEMKGASFYTPGGLSVSITDLRPTDAAEAADVWLNEQLSGTPVISYMRPET